MHCFILLPSYNEISSLRQLIPEIESVLRAQAHTIVVVDDGSQDGSANTLRGAFPQAPLQLLTHSSNEGYGASLRTGYRWIIERAQPEDVVIAMDADTTHEPRFLDRFFQRFEEGAEVVTASYVTAGASHSGLPTIRRLMSWGVNTLFRLSFPATGIDTYTNGFRGYRVDLLRKISEQYPKALILENGFPGGTELFLKAVHRGAQAAEVPFDLRYEKRGRASKINFNRTIRGYLTLLWRLKTNGLTS